ncbi:MAG: ABC transporter permease [Anaerolineae bacterium]|nr:ABC transporter permease [Anaerolineae bacterium]
MARPLRFLIRISAFVRKEAAEILRQPRLVITLVLGPFLILLLFGLGYSAEPTPLRTLFVVPEDSVLQPYLRENAETFVQQLVYEGMISDEELAKARLRSGQVDAVVVIPDKVYETVRSSQQAVITIYHNRIDPIRARYVRAFADLFVNQINQRILQVFAEESQQEASTLQPGVRAAKESTNSLHLAMESDDPEATQQHLDELDRNLTDLETALLASSLLLGRLKEMEAQDPATDPQDPTEILAQLRKQVESLEERDRTPGQEEQSTQAVTEIDQDLTRLDTALEEFRSIDSQVLVTPFRGEVRTVMAVDLSLVDYYVPGVLAVLLQHLCVTFGALSIVAERRSGTMELFQASPLSAFEVLAGKYLSYLVFTALLSAVLTGLLELALDIPMLGSWAHYSLAIVALLFASLGLGFVLSLLAQTTSQAVQYSMLALLISVFFSGFFLNLELLRASVRLISWAIPGTYALQLFQDIMLRGQPINLFWVGALVAIGAGTSLVAWLLLRRTMART